LEEELKKMSGMLRFSRPLLEELSADLLTFFPQIRGSSVTLHRIRLALVAGACVLASSSIAHATIWFVEADGSGDAPTIQAAVDSAGSLDIIELGDGLFTGEGNRDISVSKPLVFRSRSGNSPACIVDCEGSPQENHRGFSIGQDCEFRALTIEHGQADRGGAVYAAESVAAQIYDCLFVNNVAGTGGALAFDSLDLSTALPQVHIEGCTFLGNNAMESGAVYFLAIVIDFVNCSFFGNIAEDSGGVTSFVNATPSFVNCLFVNNRATAGGVIQCSDPATFEGCTFFHNAALFGAHIDCVGIDGFTSLSQCILAFGEGGAPIECSDFARVGGTVQAICTDIYGNDGGNWVQCLDNQLGENGNMESDPLFCESEIDNFQISSSSPCAAENSNGCGLIGTFGIGCKLSSVDATSWGKIKSLYR
jgi:hypothetical protein